MAIVPTIRLKKDGFFMRVNQSESEKFRAKGWVPVDGGQASVKVTGADIARLDKEVLDVSVTVRVKKDDVEKDVVEKDLAAYTSNGWEVVSAS